MMRLQDGGLRCVVVALLVVLCAEMGVAGRSRTNKNNNQPARRTREGAGGNDDFDGNIFLERFGYLDDMPDHNHDPASISQALREYQKFNGLRVTGKLDKATVRTMKKPRCGMPDVIKPGQRPHSLRSDSANAPLAYNAPGYKWENNEITYKFAGYTRQLGGNQQRSIISSAFRKWADVTPLRFRESRGNADIEINFARRQHGDGYGNAFDGRGGTLAHAFFPGVQPIAGDTHFDDDEQWTMDTPRGTNLEIVAAHEFGHALGLGHSSNNQALMAPIYRYEDNYALHRDDIAGIQSLYGAGRPTANRTPRPTRAPRPTTAPRPTRAPRPTPDPRTGSCSLKFDAIEQLSDGNVYAFRRSQVYLMSTRGATNARSIRSVFPGAPNSPGAVLYDHYRRKLFFFKGRRYWRFTGQRKDAGYPRSLPSAFHRIRAVLQKRDGSIYVFKKGREYSQWTEGLTSYPSGYPRQTTDQWRGVPTNPEASFRYHVTGYTYFFKGTRYWRFDDWGRLSSGYPKSTLAGWLNCGRTSRLTAMEMTSS